MRFGFLRGGGKGRDLASSGVVLRDAIWLPQGWCEGARFGFLGLPQGWCQGARFGLVRRGVKGRDLASSGVV